MQSNGIGEYRTDVLRHRTDYFRTAKVWMRSAKCRDGVALKCNGIAENSEVEQRQSKDAIGYV